MRTEEGDILSAVVEMCKGRVLILWKDGVIPRIRSVLGCRAVWRMKRIRGDVNRIENMSSL